MSDADVDARLRRLRVFLADTEARQAANPVLTWLA
jgi:hypothetical protein